ncbi:MAG: hypothetical protein ACR2KK_22570 [Acidimicrobiales bacterium]
MIKKLAAALAAAGSAVLLAPSAAMAGQNSASITLPPGNRVCVDVPTPAYINARGEGWSSRGVKFSPPETGDGATAWAAEASRYVQPYYFPGTFRACARNNGTLAANVNLSLRTDF